MKYAIHSDQNALPLRLYNAIELSDKVLPGCQRLRAQMFMHRPFSPQPCMHRQDPVILAPPVLEGEYKLEPGSAWYGFLQAVFSFKFKNNDDEETEEECVLVSVLQRLENWNADGWKGDWVGGIQSDILIELDVQHPVLYVLPIKSVLGKACLVPAGDTGTIPYEWRSIRSQAIKKKFQYSKPDTAPGAGDGSRMYYVNSWAMAWSSKK